MNNLLAHAGVGLELLAQVPLIQVQLKNVLRDVHDAPVRTFAEPPDPGPEVVAVVDESHVLVR